MPRPVDITLVTSEGCHFCHEAERLLDELSRVTPLTVRTVPLFSAEGSDLVVRHRAPFPPILIIEGVFFGHGRISPRKLERHLARLGDDRAV